MTSAMIGAARRTGLSFGHKYMQLLSEIGLTIAIPGSGRLRKTCVVASPVPPLYKTMWLPPCTTPTRYC
jgi:hypothetical protein